MKSLVGVQRWLGTRPVLERTVTSLFHRMYYHTRDGTFRNSWLGVRVMKSPFDLWIYQELISRLRPDLIIETGTKEGGSAFYFASICDLLDHGRIITIDINSFPGKPEHPRITYLEGSSTSPEILDRVGQAASGATVLVALDSNHEEDHVLGELDAYGPFVNPGSYLVVEDTHLNGHPVSPGFGPGPTEALEKWLPSHPEFRPDPACEKFYMTSNKGGWLQRVGGQTPAG
jgi:cephalosporin hydroxylase